MELSERMPTPDPPHPMPEDYAIAGEIAARLLEYIEARGDSNMGMLLLELDKARQGKPVRRINDELVSLVREHVEAVGNAATATLLSQLSICHLQSRLATRWVLQVMTGDISGIVEPFSRQAEHSGFRKQAAHKEYIVALAALEDIYPEVAAILKQLRDSRTKPAPYPMTSSTDDRGVY